MSSERSRDEREKRVHAVFLKYPNLLEELLGKSFNYDTLEYERTVGTRRVDFTIEGTDGKTYVIEVKREIQPTKAIQQVSEYVLALFKEAKARDSTIQITQFQPVILIDQDTVTDAELNFMKRQNFLVGVYDASDFDSLF